MFKKMSVIWIKVVTFFLPVTLVAGFLLKDRILEVGRQSKPIISQKNLASHIDTDEAAATMVVKGKLGEIQKCYDLQLDKGLNKSGRLVVQWFVDAHGFSSNFSESLNELSSVELYDCAVKAIENWKFPKNKPTYIRHTFNLKEMPRKTAYIVEGAESVKVEK